MDVDMAGFAAMQDARNHFAIFIFNVDKNNKKGVAGMFLAGETAP